MDSRLEALSMANEVAYSRYADDLFFSTRHPDLLSTIEAEVVRVIGSLGIPGKLAVNPKKTRHSSKRRARHVTGIVLGSDGNTYIGRSYKRKIRALIYTIDSLDGVGRAALAGMIAYAIGFDPQFENSLIEKYGLPKVRRALAGPD